MNTTGRNILIGVVAALAVIGIYAAVTHKGIPGPWYSSPISSSTPVTSTTTAAIENPADWKRYTNDTYHFTFLYPKYFGDLVVVSSSERRVIQYDPTTKKSVEKRIMPFITMRASTDLKSSHPDLGIGFSIFPASGYGFIDTPGGRAWSYAASSNSMWQGAQTQAGWGNWKKITPALAANTWKGYQFGTGDAGFSETIAAIPLRSQGKILEIGFGRGPAATEQIPTNQILSTLKTQ